METELEATLGYEKNQKADFLTDKKNGHSPKIFKSHYGEFQIDVPWDWNGESNHNTHSFRNPILLSIISFRT